MPPVPTASQSLRKPESGTERGPAPERSLTQRMEALKRANDILTQCRISPSKTVGGLSERQRNELVTFLRR